MLLLLRAGGIIGFMKKALIIGIAGRDGSYLAELLLAKGYEVHGIISRTSTFNAGRLDDIYEGLKKTINRCELCIS